MTTQAAGPPGGGLDSGPDPPDDQFISWFLLSNSNGVPVLSVRSNLPKPIPLSQQGLVYSLHQAGIQSGCRINKITGAGGKDGVTLKLEEEGGARGEDAILPRVEAELTYSQGVPMAASVTSHTSLVAESLMEEARKEVGLSMRPPSRRTRAPRGAQKAGQGRGGAVMRPSPLDPLAVRAGLVRPSSAQQPSSFQPSVSARAQQPYFHPRQLALSMTQQLLHCFLGSTDWQTLVAKPNSRHLRSKLGPLAPVMETVLAALPHASLMLPTEAGVLSCLPPLFTISSLQSLHALRAALVVSSSSDGSMAAAGAAGGTGLFSTPARGAINPSVPSPSPHHLASFPSPHALFVRNAAEQQQSSDFIRSPPVLPGSASRIHSSTAGGLSSPWRLLTSARRALARDDSGEGIEAALARALQQEQDQGRALEGDRLRFQTVASLCGSLAGLLPAEASNSPFSTGGPLQPRLFLAGPQLSVLNFLLSQVASSVGATHAVLAYGSLVAVASASWWQLPESIRLAILIRAANEGPAGSGLKPAEQGQERESAGATEGTPATEPKAYAASWQQRNGSPSKDGAAAGATGKHGSVGSSLFSPQPFKPDVVPPFASPQPSSSFSAFSSPVPSFASPGLPISAPAPTPFSPAGRTRMAPRQPPATITTPAATPATAAAAGAGAGDGILSPGPSTGNARQIEWAGGPGSSSFCFPLYLPRPADGATLGAGSNAVAPFTLLSEVHLTVKALAAVVPLRLINTLHHTSADSTAVSTSSSANANASERIRTKQLSPGCSIEVGGKDCGLRLILLRAHQIAPDPSPASSLPAQAPSSSIVSPVSPAPGSSSSNASARPNFSLPAVHTAISNTVEKLAAVHTTPAAPTLVSPVKLRAALASTGKKRGKPMKATSGAAKITPAKKDASRLQTPIIAPPSASEPTPIVAAEPAARAPSEEAAVRRQQVTKPNAKPAARKSLRRSSIDSLSSDDEAMIRRAKQAGRDTGDDSDDDYDAAVPSAAAGGKSNGGGSASSSSSGAAASAPAPSSASALANVTAVLDGGVVLRPSQLVLRSQQHRHAASASSSSSLSTLTGPGHLRFSSLSTSAGAGSITTLPVVPDSPSVSSQPAGAVGAASPSSSSSALPGVFAKQEAARDARLSGASANSNGSGGSRSRGARNAAAAAEVALLFEGILAKSNGQSNEDDSSSFGLDSSRPTTTIATEENGSSAAESAAHSAGEEDDNDAHTEQDEGSPLPPSDEALAASAKSAAVATARKLMRAAPLSFALSPSLLRLLHLQQGVVASGDAPGSNAAFPAFSAFSTPGPFNPPASASTSSSSLTTALGHLVAALATIVSQGQRLLLPSLSFEPKQVDKQSLREDAETELFAFPSVGAKGTRDSPFAVLGNARHFVDDFILSSPQALRLLLPPSIGAAALLLGFSPSSRALLGLHICSFAALTLWESRAAALHQQPFHFSNNAVVCGADASSTAQALLVKTAASAAVLLDRLAMQRAQDAAGDAHAADENSAAAAVPKKTRAHLELVRRLLQGCNDEDLDLAFVHMAEEAPLIVWPSPSSSSNGSGSVSVRNLCVSFALPLSEPSTSSAAGSRSATCLMTVQLALRAKPLVRRRSKAEAAGLPVEATLNEDRVLVSVQQAVRGPRAESGASSRLCSVEVIAEGSSSSLYPDDVGLAALEAIADDKEAEVQETVAQSAREQPLNATATPRRANASPPASGSVPPSNSATPASLSRKPSMRPLPRSASSSTNAVSTSSLPAPPGLLEALSDASGSGTDTGSATDTAAATPSFAAGTTAVSADKRPLPRTASAVRGLPFSPPLKPLEVASSSTGGAATTPRFTGPDLRLRSPGYFGRVRSPSELLRRSFASPVVAARVEESLGALMSPLARGFDLLTSPTAGTARVFGSPSGNYGKIPKRRAASAPASPRLQPFGAHSTVFEGAASSRTAGSAKQSQSHGTSSSLDAGIELPALHVQLASLDTNPPSSTRTRNPQSSLAEDAFSSPGSGAGTGSGSSASSAPSSPLASPVTAGIPASSKTAAAEAGSTAQTRGRVLRAGTGRSPAVPPPRALSAPCSPVFSPWRGPLMLFNEGRRPVSARSLKASALPPSARGSTTRRPQHYFEEVQNGRDESGSDDRDEKDKGRGREGGDSPAVAAARLRLALVDFCHRLAVHVSASL